MAEPERRAVIGNADNFWLHSSRTGFDLTHPPTPDETAPGLRVTIKTTTTPITVSPARSALVIVDMQNFFLSEAFGRKRGAGHAACDALVKYAIPAARKAGIQIVWLNWGLTDEEVRDMPPAIKRAFGFQSTMVEDGQSQSHGENPFVEIDSSIAVDKHGDPRHQGGHVVLENGKDGKIYKGLGSQCGSVTLPSGEKVDAGRLLMRDTWNAALYPPLDKCYEEGLKAEVPDVWLHKNRMVSSSSFPATFRELIIRIVRHVGSHNDVHGVSREAGLENAVLHWRQHRSMRGRHTSRLLQSWIRLHLARRWRWHDES